MSENFGLNELVTLYIHMGWMLLVRTFKFYTYLVISIIKDFILFDCFKFFPEELLVGMLGQAVYLILAGFQSYH